MDQILSSNQSSVILRSLAEAEVQDISYELAPSFPILAKQYREIQPTGGDINAVMNANEVSFNIVKSALLRDLQLRFEYSIGSTFNAYTALPRYYGIQFIDYIQLRTNNKVILQLSGEFIMARTDNSPEHLKNAVYRRAMPLSNYAEEFSTEDTYLASYCPIYSSFFDDVARNCFDLNFYEQLSVFVKFKPAGRLGVDSRVVTLYKCSLFVWTYRPDDNYYNMLRSKNQSPQKSLNMLCWNTFTEKQTLVGATSTTMRLNVNYPVFKTYVAIRPLIESVYGVGVPINFITFSVGGTKLIEKVPRLVADWESSKNGASDLRIARIGAVAVPGYSSTDSRVDVDFCKFTCLEWGMMPNNWTSNSGAISFSSLNYPTITVDYDTLTPTNYELVVVHAYHNILSLDSSNGSVSISVSS